jgi:hypothetical protein
LNLGGKTTNRKPQGIASTENCFALSSPAGKAGLPEKNTKGATHVGAPFSISTLYFQNSNFEAGNPPILKIHFPRAFINLGSVACLCLLTRFPMSATYRRSRALS